MVSYGSCTVNAYVPLAWYVHDAYGVISSDAHIIHNTPRYKLDGRDGHTLTRKSCTLQKSACSLLPFLNTENFHVAYTTIPYPGVSVIDIRFHVRNRVPLDNFLSSLRRSCKTGGLKSLYDLDRTDRGPETYMLSNYSTVFIEPNARVLGDTIYLHGYFDNENSANRYFDLAQYISLRA